MVSLERFKHSPDVVVARLNIFEKRPESKWLRMVLGGSLPPKLPDEVDEYISKIENDQAKELMRTLDSGERELDLVFRVLGWELGELPLNSYERLAIEDDLVKVKEILEQQWLWRHEFDRGVGENGRHNDYHEPVMDPAMEIWEQIERGMMIRTKPKEV